MMNKYAILSLLTLCVACSAPDNTGSTKNNDPKPDASADMKSKDMSTPKDMDGVQDMPRDTSGDMPKDADGDTSKDMGKDTGMDLGGDTSQDMPGDMMMDMAMDMPDFPDVMEAMCAYPSMDPMCPMGDFGPGSFITKFVIETDANAPCCRDFSGDGTPDNFIGNTLITLAMNFSPGFNVNNNIQRAIDIGRLVYLFEFHDWGNEVYDMSLGAKMLTGTDTDQDMTDNIAGMGSFHVSDESYDAQNQPIWGFTHAQVFNRKLTATGGNLRVYFPGLVEAVDLWLTDVNIEANVFPGADFTAGGGVELRHGKLSGALLRDRFFDSMNTVARQCACLNQDILQDLGGRYKCTLGSTVCESDPDEACRIVGDRQFCKISELISRQADVDTDGDGFYDAYSFGATFEAVPTTLLKSPQP